MSDHFTGASVKVNFTMGGRRFSTDVVTMPTGELRYFTSRLRDDHYKDAPEFACAWEFISAVIIPAPVTFVVRTIGQAPIVATLAYGRVTAVDSYGSILNQPASDQRDATEVVTAWINLWTRYSTDCVNRQCVGCYACC